MAPVFFRENLLSPQMAPRLPQGILDFALPPDRKLQTVELREIGRFNAMVLEDPAKFEGKRINIASDATTPREMAAAIADASDRPIVHNETPIEEVRKQSADLAKMFEWFDAVGYSADIEGLRRDYQEVGWRTFGEWAGEQVWHPAPTGGQRPARPAHERPGAERHTPTRPSSRVEQVR